MPGTNLSKLVLCASVIAGTLSSPSRVDAATLSLSEGPLFLGTSVEPNILMLIDDSGSMDWMLVAPGSGTDGIMDGPPQSNTQAIDGTWPMFECIANAVPFAGLNSSGDCNADNDAGRLVRNGSSGTPRIGPSFKSITGTPMPPATTTTMACRRSRRRTACI